MIQLQDYDDNNEAIIKFLVLLLSVLGLSTIWMAVFADVGVTLISILSVLTIIWRKIK